MFITLFIHNIFLLTGPICFFLQSKKREGKVICFIMAEWLSGKESPRHGFNVLVTLALNILLWLLAGAALSRCPVFSYSILFVNVELV